MLTDTKARQARRKEKPYKLTDHGGLYLYIALAGAKSWRYDYLVHGRRDEACAHFAPIRAHS